MEFASPIPTSAQYPNPKYRYSQCSKVLLKRADEHILRTASDARTKIPRRLHSELMTILSEVTRRTDTKMIAGSSP